MMQMLRRSRERVGGSNPHWIRPLLLGLFGGDPSWQHQAATLSGRVHFAMYYWARPLWRHIGGASGLGGGRPLRHIFPG